MGLNREEQKVVIIIQARMGSTRFPGKMMALLNGSPLIEWVIKRCKKSYETSDVVLSTSDMAIDDVLVDKATVLNIGVDRGCEDDVLKRYSSAAKKYNADIVVRVCGDRPLVDPELVDMAVREYSLGHSDLVYNHIAENGQNWPRGFGAEVISAKLLHWMDENLTSSYHREHVTPYIWENKEKFTVSPVLCPIDIDPKVNDLRFDVDMPEDLEGLNRLCCDFDMYVGIRAVLSKWKVAHRGDVSMRVASK